MNKTLPPTPELKKIAKKVVWFKPPEETLQETIFFVIHVMTYGSFKDMQILRKYVSDDDLRYALKHAPPGIIDPRSWSYWHLMLDCYPPPPLPTRFGVKVDWQE